MACLDMSRKRAAEDTDEGSAKRQAIQVRRLNLLDLEVASVLGGQAS